MGKLTQEKVKELINKASTLELEIVWIPRIMARQTDQEVNSEATLEHNHIGLNGFDGRIIGSYYHQIQEGKHLSFKQAEKARKQLQKYSRQYVEIANERQAIPA